MVVFDPCILHPGRDYRRSGRPPFDLVHKRVSLDSLWEDGGKEWLKGNGKTKKFGLLERKDGKGWHSVY